MKLDSLTPPIGERLFLTGQTGSGKTTLAEFLLSKRKFVVVYDGKGRIDWKNYKRFTRFKDLIQSDNEKLIYKPNWDELAEQDPETVDKFFQWIYQRGNTTLYVDEIYSIVIGSKLPRYYHAVLTRGRELGISVWSGCQRPMLIPQTVLSESENAFAFRLSLTQDRDKMENLYNIDADKLNVLKEKYFYAIKRNGSKIDGPYTLRIRRR